MMQGRTHANARGIDVSHWQGTIDWNQVREGGITFAFIKATEGIGYVDPLFHTNFGQSKQVGILRGAYHFARPAASSAEKQASYFLSTMEGESTQADLPVALDLEDAGGLEPHGLVRWANEWIQHVQAATQRLPIVYVSPSFAHSYLSDTLAALPLWVANWGVSRPETMNIWQKWTFWQYSGSGKVQGVTGNVDLDVYAGTVNDLRTRWGSLSASVASGSGKSGLHVPSHSRPELTAGDTGVEVKDLQMLLYRADLHPGLIDGVFGAETLHAVTAFQAQVQVAVDSIVGPDTWSYLLQQPIVSRPLLERGNTGQQVKDAQYLLTFWGARPGPVDGSFGALTDAAVRRFQERTQAAVDGIVGLHTWHHLLEKLR